MKTIKLISGILLLTALFFSCSANNDSPLSCEEATAATLLAEQAYDNATSTNHDDLCNAYKTALQTQIGSCGDASGALQTIIDDLGDCTLTPAGNGVITVTVGTLVKTFETNVTVTTVGSIRKVRAEDNMSSSDFIYFEIQQGATGPNSISNFNIHLISSDYNPMPVVDGGNWSSNITVNNTTNINGTFFGYVTSPTTGADLDLNLGSINVQL